MRIVVIGGTGHIGTYLVPRLVVAGHEVTVVTRGQRQAYQSHPAWSQVRQVEIDRRAAERDGTFGGAIRDLRPEVVMDMLCFDAPSARQLVEALRGEIQLLAHCGTIWVHGYPVQSPVTEDQPRNPLEAYGRGKCEVEAYLLDQARRAGFPATILHPGHIVGPGWAPVAPTGCHDPAAFARLARGEELALPNLGLETLHHVHASDVAQAFEKALTHWNQAVGESFFVVSPAALTLRGFAEAAAAWFGKTANLRFLPLEAWKSTLPENFIEPALAHLSHSSNHSIAKAQRLLEYAPRYTSLEAVREAVFWLIENGQLEI
jgi:nucleoside-diphosphate-sugar epimerase